MKIASRLFFAVCLIGIINVTSACGGPETFTVPGGSSTSPSGSESPTTSSELENLLAGNSFSMSSGTYQEDLSKVCDEAKTQEGGGDSSGGGAGSVIKKTSVFKSVKTGEAGTVTFNKDGTVDVGTTTMEWKVIDKNTIRVSYGDCEYWDVSIDGDVLNISLPAEFDCTGDYCSDSYVLGS